MNAIPFAMSIQLIDSHCHRVRIAIEIAIVSLLISLCLPAFSTEGEWRACVQATARYTVAKKHYEYLSTIANANRATELALNVGLSCPATMTQPEANDSEGVVRARTRARDAYQVAQKRYDEESTSKNEQLAIQAASDALMLPPSRAQVEQARNQRQMKIDEERKDADTREANRIAFEARILSKKEQDTRSARLEKIRRTVSDNMVSIYMQVCIKGVPPANFLQFVETLPSGGKRRTIESLTCKGSGSKYDPEPWAADVEAGKSIDDSEVVSPWSSQAAPESAYEEAKASKPIDKPAEKSRNILDTLRGVLR